MNLTRFPRIRLAHRPTALGPLPLLPEALGGPEIWVKRDDCAGLATGGNKTRKLAFLTAEAADGAEIVLTQGVTQSKHARKTGAAAARLWTACHLLLEDRTGFDKADCRENDDVLIDRLCGATTTPLRPRLDMNAEPDAAAARIRGDGRRVYVVPRSGLNPTGALGHVNCSFELLWQIVHMGRSVDRVVHATGSAGPQSGLVGGHKAAALAAYRRFFARS